MRRARICLLINSICLNSLNNKLSAEKLDENFANFEHKFCENCAAKLWFFKTSGPNKVQQSSSKTTNRAAKVAIKFDTAGEILEALIGLGEAPRHHEIERDQNLVFGMIRDGSETIE